MIPACLPSASITRTSGARMCWLTRIAGSLDGGVRKSLRINHLPRLFHRSLFIAALFSRLVSKHQSPPTHNTNSLTRRAERNKADFSCGQGFSFEQIDEVIERHSLVLGSAQQAERDGARGCLAFTDDDHVGDLGKLCLAHLEAEFLVAQIGGRAETRTFEQRRDLGGVRFDLFAEREHPGLIGREPEGQDATSVLEQNTDEAFERAEDRAMDHRGARLRAGAGREGEVEALGHVVVELDGGELPFALERVGHVNLDFRSVERALAQVYFIRKAVALERLAESVLTLVP